MANRTAGPRGFGTSKKKCWFEEVDQIIPGPGSHDSKRIDIIECPKWPIGADTNRQSFLEVQKQPRPSPFHYKLNLNSIQKHSPKATIPKGNAIKTNLGVTTFYNPDHSVVKAQQPSFSFGYSTDTNFNTDVPGPGNYDCSLKQTTFNKTQNGLGTSQRPLPYGEPGKNPGPNKYVPFHSKKSEEYSFPKSLRKDSQLISKNDPPAVFYNLSPKKKTIRASGNYSNEVHRQRSVFQIQKQTPAPDAYNIPINKIRNVVLERSNRSSLNNKETMKFPGPQQYDTINAISLEKGKNGISFPRQLQRLSDIQWITLGLGPAAYQHPNIFSKIGGAIGKQQQSQQVREPSPGSGDYSPKEDITSRKTQSTIVFKSKRVDFSRTITGAIGPGSYRIQNEAATIQLGKMGKSDRKQLTRLQQNPGVGSYNIPTYFGKLPNYYDHSPRKISEKGYSIYHQKLTKMMHKQRMNNKFTNPELQYSKQGDSSHKIGKSQVNTDRSKQL